MTSTQQERSQAWWMKQRRKLPWPAVYLIVLGITGSAQFAGFKLAGALSPDSWAYPMPKQRVVALKAEPFSTQLFAPVLPTNAPGNQLLSTSSVTPTPGVGSPVPTDHSTPSQTPTPTPSATVGNPAPIRDFEMSADAAEASPGDSFRYDITLVSQIDLATVVVTTHLPEGLTTRDVNCNWTGDHQCQWTKSLEAGKPATITFKVSVSHGETEWENHAHLRVGTYQKQSNDCTVRRAE